MRRPSFCCENHAATTDGRCRQQGGGAFARVRRFLSDSLGRRPVSSTTPTTTCLQTPSPCAEVTSVDHAADLLAQLFTRARGWHTHGTGVVMGVLGKPLDEVMTLEEGESDHGVPSLVHALCCYMLTHGVDFDTLVSEDWCPIEVRTRLDTLADEFSGGSAQMRHDPARDATVAAGLLRLFLQELPHPLMPPGAAVALLAMLDELSVGDTYLSLGPDDDLMPTLNGEKAMSQIRQLLLRRVPSHNLRLLQYLTAFIHQLRTANHNTCPVPVDSLSRVLARVLIDGGGDIDCSSSHRVAELFVVHHKEIFEGLLDEQQNSVSSVSGAPESPDGDEIVTGYDNEDQPSVNSVDDVVNEREADDDGGEEDSTTTTDTDDFRSPPVSPIRASLLSLPESSSKCHRSLEVGGVCNAWPVARSQRPEASLPFDLASPVTHDPSASLTPDPISRDPAAPTPPPGQVGMLGNQSVFEYEPVNTGSSVAGKNAASGLSLEKRLHPLQDADQKKPATPLSSAASDSRTEQARLKKEYLPSSPLSPRVEPTTQKAGNQSSFQPCCLQTATTPVQSVSAKRAAPAVSGRRPDCLSAGMGGKDSTYEEQAALSAPQHRKRKEHAEGGPAEHDPKIIRSASEVADVDSIRNKLAPSAKGFLPCDDVLQSPEDSGREDDNPSTSTDVEEQIVDTSCVSATEYWETGVESDGGHNAAHEERRHSERFFPREPQASRRTRRKTKRRHSAPQNLGVQVCLPVPQNEEKEVEKSPGLFLSKFTSGEDELSAHKESTSIEQHQRSPALSELLASSEPVQSDRGSWGIGRNVAVHDSWHRTGHRYNRYEDDSRQMKWYQNEDPMLSSRTRTYFDSAGTPTGHEYQGHVPGQCAVKVLMKNINSIKKKIKRFEEDFEAAFGYRPSHSEKMKHKDIKKYMTDLNKARKELKQTGLMSVPSVFPLSLLKCQEAIQQQQPSSQASGSPGTANTLRQVEERLQEKRSASGRPTELAFMTSAEIYEEKTELQKALLYYESIHGRPTTREDRDLARPLYDRYRQVKRSVMRSSSRTKENSVELAPILEHEAMDFTLASPQHRGSQEEEYIKETQELSEIQSHFQDKSDSEIDDLTSKEDEEDEDDEDGGRSAVAISDLHALPVGELRERKKIARDEKKKLRRALREFEEKFESEHGRKVQKEDRGPLEQTYLDYKHAKAKVRLLEALLSKHEPVKF